MTPPHNRHTGRRTNPILIYKSLATYLNHSKSRKCWYYHIDIDVISLFCSNGEKKPKIDKNN